MRHLQVLVPDEGLKSVVEVLDDEGVDHVRQRVWTDGDERWLVEIPLPTDAIGHVLGRLEDVGIETDQYTLIGELEGAMTPQAEPLQERFASDFDPLSRAELRSKARDMSHDPTSFLAMIALSSIIAVSGLLVGSPAIVVGSMVIAPIVGPVLTAAVGSATGDGKMLWDSVWLQAGGLAVAVFSAWAFSVGLQVVGYFPVTLDVSSIDLIAIRVAPTFVTLAVGLASGAAAAFGLTTKGPTSVIGVMIAAALVPAAATVGIAGAWNEYRIAVGSALLLALTIVLINAGAVAVLRRFEYRPEQEGWLLPSRSSVRRAAVVATALAVVALVVVVGGGTFQQIAFERTVNGEVRATLDDPAYEGLEPVAVRIQYGGWPVGSPETVTVTASRRADGGDPPAVADALDRRITAETGRAVDVRVLFETYHHSGTTTRPEVAGRSTARGPSESHPGRPRFAGPASRPPRPFPGN